MNDFFRRMLYLPPQGTQLAAEIDFFHYFVISVTMLGATAVFATALWFTWRYRRNTDFDVTPLVKGGLVFEVGVIVSLLTLFISIWVFGFHQYMNMQIAPEGAMDVYVVGKRWMWKFAYPNGIRSQGVLVVPEGKDVRLIMTSRDVIHSYYVPTFRMKQDVLPGRYTTLWFRAERAGIYRAYCAEYCGEAHSAMWADVVVLRAEEFRSWEEGGTPPQLLSDALKDFGVAVSRGGGVAVPRTVGAVGDRLQSMAQRGREVAASRGCLSCHTLDGQNHLGPSWRGLWGSQRPLATGEVVVADEAYLTRSMMDPGVQLTAGYQNLMPTYQGQLDPEEVASLLELIKSLRDPLQQPADIQYPMLPAVQVELLIGPQQGASAGVPPPDERQPAGLAPFELQAPVPEGAREEIQQRRSQGGGIRRLETDDRQPEGGTP